MHELSSDGVNKINKSDSMSESPFLCDDHVNICPLSSLYSVTRKELISAQHADETLQESFSLAPGGGNDSSLEPRIQIVVPLTFHQAVLQLSHQGLAGHMGVWKMYDTILRKFYWP